MDPSFCPSLWGMDKDKGSYTQLKLIPDKKKNRFISIARKWMLLFAGLPQYWRSGFQVSLELRGNAVNLVHSPRIRYFS